MFESLKRLEVAGKTSWLDLSMIGEGARVELAPASDANQAFFNALLKKQGKHKPRRGKEITAADLETSREDDRDLYARYIIKGWEQIPGPNGPVPYSPSLTAEFLDCLPNWLFDLIRVHANDPMNYVDAAEALPDPETLSGNSESGSDMS